MKMMTMKTIATTTLMTLITVEIAAQTGREERMEMHDRYAELFNEKSLEVTEGAIEGYRKESGWSFQIEEIKCTAGWTRSTATGDEMRFQRVIVFPRLQWPDGMRIIYGSMNSDDPPDENAVFRGWTAKVTTSRLGEENVGYCPKLISTDAHDDLLIRPRPDAKGLWNDTEYGDGALNILLSNRALPSDAARASILMDGVEFSDEPFDFVRVELVEKWQAGKRLFFLTTGLQDEWQKVPIDIPPNPSGFPRRRDLKSNPGDPDE